MFRKHIPILIFSPISYWTQRKHLPGNPTLTKNIHLLQIKSIKIHQISDDNRQIGYKLNVMFQTLILWKEILGKRDKRIKVKK